MVIYLIAVGHRMDKWIETGYAEYAKRMPQECQLKLIEIAAEKRSKNATASQYKARECTRIMKAIPNNCLLIALDEYGIQWSTKQLSEQMEKWMFSGQDVCLLVGGPDGLDQQCLQKTSKKWALSKLTLPHPLVRVVLSEQIYRAWSLLKNHPYHRA